MDTQARTTYTVEVSGSWLDPRTLTEQPRTETFRILTGHRRAAETAAVQLYGSAAAAERCLTIGSCTAKAG